MYLSLSFILPKISLCFTLSLRKQMLRVFFLGDANINFFYLTLVYFYNESTTCINTTCEKLIQRRC